VSAMTEKALKRAPNGNEFEFAAADPLTRIPTLSFKDYGYDVVNSTAFNRRRQYRHGRLLRLRRPPQAHINFRRRYPKGRKLIMSGTVARIVYVISDLHLGGTYSRTPTGRGFRINTRVDLLTQFVESITTSPADGPKIELVINGDIVDFLAEGEPA